MQQFTAWTTDDKKVTQSASTKNENAADSVLAVIQEFKRVIGVNQELRYGQPIETSSTREASSTGDQLPSDTTAP